MTAGTLAPARFVSDCARGDTSPIPRPPRRGAHTLFTAPAKTCRSGSRRPPPPWFKRLVTDRCQHGIGTMRDGLMGKPRLTRGLGARVLCTAPRRGFPHRSLCAICSPSLCRFVGSSRALRKKAASVSGIMGNRVPAVLCIRENSEPCRHRADAADARSVRAMARH